jgi:hypothetical protein
MGCLIVGSADQMRAALPSTRRETHMTAHAIYAPSGAHRWTHCTASASGIAALGERPEGDEAAEGTAAHAEIERCLGTPTIPLPVDPKHPAAFGVALVLDYVRQLPPGRLWIEQRVELTKDIWGRCDVAHWDDLNRVLTIVDYKNGHVNVEAEANEQLMIYAAASIFTHNLPALWVRLVVVQPNSFMPVPRVKQSFVSADELYRFASRVAAIPAGSLEFKAGEHCTYCPLFGRCPPTKDLMTRLSQVIEHPAAEVSNDHVAMFLALEKPIKDWFDELNKAATKRAVNGNVPQGMKVVATQKHRAWKDTNVARTAIADKLGIGVLNPPTPAQAEKIGMELDWVQANSDRPEGGPALAFASDKRPEFKRKDVKEMFAAAVQQVRREDAA